jgi:hypothetical protein
VSVQLTILIIDDLDLHAWYDCLTIPIRTHGMDEERPTVLLRLVLARGHTTEKVPNQNRQKILASGLDIQLTPDAAKNAFSTTTQFSQECSMQNTTFPFY